MRIYSFSNHPQKKSKFNFKKIRFHLPPAKKLFLWAFRLTGIGILALALLFTYFWFTLPSPEKLATRDVPESTKIFDRNGQLLYEVHGEYKRTLVNSNEIIPDVKNATVAIEDKDFYKHSGISFWAIFRTAVTDIIKRRSAGGSTITQQYVKNAVFTNKKSPIRKLKEAFLAIQIDAKYSKEEILTFYLNEIPYGRNAYGVEAAAQAYFAKSAKDLTLSESAYLAALPQAPSYYSPTGPNRDALDSRHATVLKDMREQGYITEDQEKAALAEKVTFQQAKTALLAPHFVLYVQDYLAQKYGEKNLEEGGLKVYTTLDADLQKAAEKIVKEQVEKSGPKYNANNAGLVAIDPKTGQILAMVGSKDYFAESSPAGCTGIAKNCTFEPNVNVTLSSLQPGSSFKPYVYVTAFKKDFGYAPASMLMDVTTNFGTFNGKSYVPHNYSGGNFGPVSMRQALAGSLNIPAVKTLSLVGVDNATQTARDLGITTPLSDCGLSLVLGSCEVKLIDHTAAMSVLANMGKRNDKTPILKIEDKDGSTLEEYKQNEREVIDPKAVYQLISIMTDNGARSYIFGANSPLNFGDRPVACKTGTTNNWHDGWTMCFTPQIAVGVWAGNNNGDLLKKGADGVYVAAPIVHEFINQALKDKPVEQFQKPDGIVEVVVDKTSGKLPTQFSPETRYEVFADYNVPKDYDNVHIGVKIDLLTGELATELTPPERIGYKQYTVFHSERPQNPNWETPVREWAASKGYEYPPENGIIAAPDGGNPGNTDEFTLTLSEPLDNSTIMQLPFSVTAQVPDTKTIARLDLSIDGTLIESKSDTSSFSINKKLPDGQHTIVVKVIATDGKSASSSVNVIYSLSSPLYLSSPSANDSVSFPATLTAVASSNLGSTSFYYQVGNASAKLLGSSDGNSSGNQYQYQLDVSDIPVTGNVKIFAKAGPYTSNKVTINVLP